MEDGIKTNTSPLICCCTTLWKVNGHLYSTALLIRHKVMKKRLITVNVCEECYFFVFLHRLISVMCLKCPPVRALFNAVPNVVRHDLKEWVTQQTKYCTNVIMTSCSIRNEKINTGKQMKTHKTDAAWHEAYYLLANMNVKLYCWHISQGSAATDLRGGDSFNSIFLHRSLIWI